MFNITPNMEGESQLFKKITPPSPILPLVLAFRTDFKLVQPVLSQSGAKSQSTLYYPPQVTLRNRFQYCKVSCHITFLSLNLKLTYMQLVGLGSLLKLIGLNKLVLHCSLSLNFCCIR